MLIEFIATEEVNELVDKINQEYGYDFSNYSQASLKRRIIRVMNNSKIISVKELQNRILSDKVFFNRFIDEITVNVTEMFRDPLFYYNLVDEIFPKLEKLPFIRIWHAGCSSGEEVYSLAILLKENNLLNKSLLYATDINQTVLEIARIGEYDKSMITEAEKNYELASGNVDLAKHFSLKGNRAIISQDLKEKIVFSHHNLAIDQSFNEFDLIFCRNVLIYFNRTLQNKVYKLFLDSLTEEGYLALGTKETIEFSSVANHFHLIDKKNKIWKRKKL